MKKIIKIVALGLALICIGTSCASCGKNQSSPGVQSNEIQVTEKQTLSNWELAYEIKTKIVISRENVDYVNSENYSRKDWYADKIFPKGDLGQFIPETEIPLFDTKVNDIERTFELKFFQMYHIFGKNNGKTVITIRFPIEIKNTTYGIVSEDKKSVIAEYHYDASNYPETVYIQPDITITY